MIPRSTPPPRRRGPDLWDAAAGGTIFALALALRLVYVHQIAAAGLAGYLRLDPLYYHLWARRIAAGEWIGADVFEMSPLYAYFLAVLYLAFGEGLILPRVIQSVAGAAVCALLALSGRRTFGKAEGALAGAALALYGPAIFYDGQVMKTSFEISLTTLAALAFLAASVGKPDRRVRWIFAGGLLLGLTALMRENILIAAPMYLAWSLLPRPAAEEAAARTGAWRGRLAPAAALAAGAALPILPATAHNVLAARDPVLITSLGGENFYTGNNEHASGRYTPPPFIRPDTQYEHEDFRREAARRAGRPLSRREASRFWLREGLRFIAGSPGRYLALLGDKLVVFWNDFERPDNFSYDNFRRFSPLLGGPLLHFAWVAPAGLLGLALSARRWRELLPLHLMLAAFVGSALIFFTQSRYRAAAVPILILFGAHACAELVRAARARRLRTLAWSLPALALATLAVTRDPGNSPLFEAQNRSLLGEMNLEAGRLSEAAAEYRACISALEAPPSGDTIAGRRIRAAAHLGLARVLLKAGDEAGAVRELREAAASPREDVRYSAAMLLGAIEAARGDLAAAAGVLRVAVEARPDDFEARMSLAEALARAGRPRESLAEVDAALRIRPASAEALRARQALAAGGAGAGEPPR